MKRKGHIKPLGSPVTLSIYTPDGWKPIATIDSKDFNPSDLYEKATHSIFDTNKITVNFEGSFIMPNETDYSDLDETLNTLGITLQSDLEADDE